MRKADLVTALRIIFVILSIFLLYINSVYGLILIPIVFFLDYLDGFFAKREKETEYGKRLDVAGDRIAEYLYYFIFTVLGLIPIFIFPVIVVRNCIVDSFFYTKEKNFSTTKTKIAKSLSSSHFARGVYAALKMITFFYFGCIAVGFDLPIFVGYILLSAVVIFSLARGAADIYEAFHKI
jgi:phosphatidylglycerophosphate synthase